MGILGRVMEWIKRHAELWGFLELLVAILALFVTIFFAARDFPPLEKPASASGLFSAQEGFPVKSGGKSEGAKGKASLSVHLKDKVVMRQTGAVSSAVLCTLMPMDYIMPRGVESYQGTDWCRVRIVKSENCKTETEGYIPLVLAQNCYQD